MRISHIFHNLNLFGGAEEHIATLTGLQKANGHEVSLFLVQSSNVKNQYYQRLRHANVRVHQWPVWISRLSGDWDTREAILKLVINLLTPGILTLTYLLSLSKKRTQVQIRKSIEGRIRAIFKGLIDLRRERQLFLFLLSWSYHRRKPDILHLHSYGAGLEYVLQWAHRYRIPIVYQEHSTPDTTTRKTYRLPQKLNLANIVIAVSESSANGLHAYCGVQDTIRVIPPIVSINNIGHGKPRNTDGASEIHILTIARLSEEKGLTVLIAAAEEILSCHSETQFKIYGEGWLRTELEDLCKRKQIQNNVCFAGRFLHAELSDIMQDADIFVLPSITEGLPLSIIEAMAWGKPIISTLVGGIPGLIENGVNGLLCKPGDANELALKIHALIVDPDLRRKLGSAAQLSYQEGPYHPETVLKQYESVYHEAIRLNHITSPVKKGDLLKGEK